MKKSTAEKAAAVFIAAVLLFSLCACGAEKNESSAEKSVQNSSEAVAAVAEESIEEASGNKEDSQLPETAESSAEKAESSVQEASQEESSAVEEISENAESSAEEEKSKAQESSKEEEKIRTQESSSEQSSQQPQQSIEPSRTESSAPTVEVTGITLSDSSITLYKGYNYTITAQLMPANATDRNFTWNWSDDNVISVNSYGTVTAKAVGSTVITAKTTNNKTASCQVQVIEKPVQRVQQQPSQPVQQSSQSVQQPEASQQQSKPATPELTGTYVGSAWFDDAVFVGDSVSVKLQYYAENGCLGNADFLCAVSLGYNNSLWDLNRRGNVHPLYQGKKVTVDEGVRLCGKKKVFIMLGMNDIGTGVNYAINGMQQLTDRILQKSPDVQIYIQSVTPLLKTITRSDKLNNYNVAKFNEAARKVCDERGFIFVNVAEAVDDGNGNLLYENCGDPGYMGLHFSYAGCSKWVDYLKRHVA